MSKGCDPFVITVSGDLAAVFAKVKKMADEAGVRFEGSTASGTFEGKGISGNYSSAGDQVTIKITEKPWIYPCSVIESKIRAFFVN